MGKRVVGTDAADADKKKAKTAAEKSGALALGTETRSVTATGVAGVSPAAVTATGVAGPSPAATEAVPPGAATPATEVAKTPATVGQTGPGPSGEAPEYVCLAAAELLRKYSTGVQRVPLEKLGVSPHNRAISGKHVHKLGRRIVSVEGFCRFRYQHGWAHEPNPHDVLEVSRYTNRVAERDKLLAPVPSVPLLGSFAKTHLLSFLQALKSGCIYWADNQELMVPPPAQATLLEHLQLGMFYEVLSYEAVADHLPALQALIASDNFDAGFALGQTEMQLLQSMHQCMQVVQPPRGCSLWDVVKQQIVRTVGASWPEADLICFYNFCKVVGTVRLMFLADTVTLFVDVDRVTVRATDFQLVSRLHPSLVWMKIMFIVIQYLSQDDKMVAGPQGKAFGAQLARADFERFAKMPVDKLMPVETFIQEIFKTYSAANLPGVSAETLARELPAFLVRTGKHVLLWKDTEDSSPVDYGKLEQKLRQCLKTDTLPAAVRGGEPGCLNTCSGKVAKKSKQIQPDETPALSFDHTGIIDNVVAQARARGIVVGAAVTCTADQRGIAKGTPGVVIGIDREVAVRWNLGTASDKKAIESEMQVTLNAVALAAAGAAAPGQPKQEKASPTVALPAGTAWVPRTKDHGRQAIQALVHAHLYQLYITHTDRCEAAAHSGDAPGFGCL